MQPDDLEAHVEKLFAKYARPKGTVRWRARVGGRRVVFVAFGTVARLTKEAIEILRPGRQGRPDPAHLPVALPISGI
jgi:hypothetical protein